MKKKICIVLCLGCIGTVSVVGCSNKNFDSKVTGDNQTTTENVSDILNDQEKKEGGYENESSSKVTDSYRQVVMLMTKRTQRTIQKCWQMQICVELFWNFQTQDVISA